MSGPSAPGIVAVVHRQSPAGSGSLDERDARADAGGDQRRDQAARATTQHDEIEVVAAHAGPLGSGDSMVALTAQPS